MIKVNMDVEDDTLATVYEPVLAEKILNWIKEWTQQEKAINFLYSIWR